MSDDAHRPRWRKTKIALGIFVVLLLALLIPPYISLNSFRRQMTASISRSLGRNVQIRSMHLQLLPTPGIVLKGFTVDADPAFGSEPALVAPTVVATLRVSSLWRRPIEVSSIHMEKPSVNLVRNARGKWNFSSILLQAARIPHAPTTQPHASSKPRFPYIEMSHGRINFKDGLAKLPFSLFNADFAIWQESAARWRIRLHAQPVRTDLDLDLGDTGTVRLDGSIGRTTHLDTMPVHLNLSWHNAQLGQASRLLSGQDLGWRGQLNMDGTLRGTLQSLALKWKIHIDNTHRIEFTPLSSPSFNASCQATYHDRSFSIDQLLCLLPTPPGHLLLTGSIPDLNHPTPSLRLEVNHLPAAFWVQMFGLVRLKAGSVHAQGAMNGEFTYGPQPATKTPAHARRQRRKRPASLSAKGWSGHAAFAPLTLHLDGLNHPVTVPQLTVYAGGPSVAPPARRHATRHRRHKIPWPEPARPTRIAVRRPVLRTPKSGLPPFRIIIAPAQVPLGAPTPLTVSGSLGSRGFQLQLDGKAAVADLAAVQRQLGALPLHLNSFAAQGTADLNVTLSGPWIAPFPEFATQPSVAASGSVELSHIKLHPQFLSGPATLSKADVSLTVHEVTWNAADFKVGAVRGTFSASYPTLCQAAACPAHFDLALPKAGVPQILAAFTGSDAHGVLWADLLAHLNEGHVNWPAANGVIHIGELTAGPLDMRKALANVTLSGTSLKIASFRAAALDGTLHAQGSIFAGGDSPAWHLSLNGESISMQRFAALFHHHWGEGLANMHARFTMNGWSPSDLASSANGTFTFTWTDGGLGKTPPLDHFRRWSAHGSIANSQLTLAGGTLIPLRHQTPIPVSGTIGFDRTLHLTLGAPASGASASSTAKSATTKSSADTSAHAKHPVTVTGTLNHPRLAPTS